ncbi:MAG: hypothetical protein KF817_13305 [Phycisphaeraceae bacterium]|nr:hypothetical protein [Phycisphaeraceae bacterium]
MATPAPLPFLFLLGQEDPASDRLLSGPLVDRLNVLNRPDDLLDGLASLPLVAAMSVVAVGVLCVLNGYRWHKWVVAILAFLAGLGIGHALAQEMGRPTIVAAAVGCLCAIVATPLLKITVAIFGGLTGAFIGVNAWSVAQPESVADARWAGALLGFVVLAMASLILYRFVVVLFTSVGGSLMVVFGAITLLMHVPSWDGAVRETFTSTPMLVPLLVALAAVGGFVLQESRMRADGVRLLSNDPKTTA